MVPLPTFTLDLIAFPWMMETTGIFSRRNLPRQPCGYGSLHSGNYASEQEVGTTMFKCHSMLSFCQWRQRCSIDFIPVPLLGWAVESRPWPGLFPQRPTKQSCSHLEDRTQEDRGQAPIFWQKHQHSVIWFLPWGGGGRTWKANVLWAVYDWDDLEVVPANSHPGRNARAQTQLHSSYVIFTKCLSVKWRFCFWPTLEILRRSSMSSTN